MKRRTMKGTLTIRLPGPALKQLRERARREGTTSSEIVRRLVEKGLAGPGSETTLYERSRRWVGAVRSEDVPAGRDAREALATWEPDRRG